MLLQRLFPHLSGFRLLTHQRIEGVLYLALSLRRRSATCPRCQCHSTAVHSSYKRTIADLPMVGTQVLLPLQVRRFFCRQAACPRRMFAERFPALVPVYGRHSLGVSAALRLVGIAKGLLKDAAAVRAGLSLIWSNGPMEGFVHRLKLLKRQAYGRAGVDFLRHRILAACAGVAA